MFLVQDRRFGTTNLVFLGEDPRKDGYAGSVIEGVTLDYDMEAVHSWSEGQARPEACVGRAMEHPKHYKIFRYRKDLQAAGYEPVSGTLSLFGSWSDYLKFKLDPPNPEHIDDLQWYDYLDKVDEDSRCRRQRGEKDATPVSKSRDELASWLAKRHFIADSAIREVWYLPQESPSEEIRLLEVSDRFTGSESMVEPVDFGLDVAGESLRLLVADITSEQLELIKQDPTRLPSGWSLRGAKHWSRRGT
jgi:hypothetical protein